MRGTGRLGPARAVDADAQGHDDLNLLAQEGAVVVDAGGACVTIRRLTRAARCPVVPKAGSPRRRRGYAGRARRAQNAHQERPTSMMEESEAEKRTDAGIACGPDQRALVTQTGRAEAAEAASAQTLDVASDAGTSR